MVAHRDIRRHDHARLMAREAVVGPTISWWTKPMTRAEFQAKGDARAREVEGTTTQHIQRREGDK
jgi:hypothetical protein